MQKNRRPSPPLKRKADVICHVADTIWANPELSLQEVKSAALYCRVLEQEGFQVEKGVCGIPTAFTASFGSGRPHIGILAEYDALSGLSQKAGSLTQEELVPGGCGHGCGHNLLGAGALAAALGVKAYLEAGRCSRHRDALRLPRRGGRRSQGLHGPGQPVASAGRRPDMAPGGQPTRSSPAPPTPVFRCSTPSTALRPTPQALPTGAAAHWTPWS